MIRPIPVMNSLFEQSHRSRFLPLSEKYAQPIVAKFMPNPIDNMPLDELLSKSASENLILPGMMEGLLGDDLGALPNLGGLGMPDISSIKKQFQDIIGPGITEQPTLQATQQQPGQKAQSVVNPQVFWMVLTQEHSNGQLVSLMQVQTPRAEEKQSTNF